MRIDLHMHSTASDGVYSPSEVVRIAHTNNVALIALSDHDTVDGYAAARAEGQTLGLEVWPAVELSAEDAHVDRHILGYLFRPQDGPFLAFLAELRQARVDRINQIVRKLAALGVPIETARVLELADGGSVGRPHVARALLEKGYVGSLLDAFKRYLYDGGPAYVPHHALPPNRAIEVIHAAGGVAVLAHPGRYADPLGRLDELIPLGIDGVEVYYPDHAPALISALRGRAQRHNLIITAGSDFHRREGDGSARIGHHNLPTGLDLITPLLERAARYR